MPIITSHYHAPIWIANKHLQTILPARFRIVKDVSYKRERIFTIDDDFIDLDWSFHDAKKLAIITYGVTGTSHSSYVLGMIKTLSHLGYDALVWNYRNRIEPNKLRSITHGASSEDLQRAIEHSYKCKSYQETVLIGFSLGGTIVLKYLGEKENNAHKYISKAVTISAPCDLKSSIKEICKWKNFLYHRDCLNKIKDELLRKKGTYKNLMQDIYLKNIYNVENLTSQAIVPLNNFSDAEKYYQICNSKQYIPNISIPTLILNAKNDPLLTNSNFPVKECEDHKLVSLEMPKDGGHLGFMLKTINGLYYSEKRTAEFLNWTRQ